MTKLIVDFDLLAKYSKNMDEYAREFGMITRNMDEIISSLKKRGWKGYDANTFINNAQTYLNDLRVVQNALFESSASVSGRNKKYVARVDDYFDKMRARSERDEQRVS